MKMMERKAYTALGETGFGKAGFDEMGFDETGRHQVEQSDQCVFLCFVTRWRHRGRSYYL